MCNVFLVASLIFFASFNTVRAETNKTFPKEFIFGVSTSAYQTEGAWDEDLKGENIWDRWIHADPSRIKNNDTADVACNSYHYANIDVAIATTLDISHYRFSISWSRLLPTGLNNSVNKNALTYYRKVIDSITKSELIAVAALYYYDLPQPLQDLGGWQNPDMVRYFADYARVAFKYFPEVQYWITFNDPRTICRLGYGEGLYPPGIDLDGVGDYQCSYVVLKAHAAAYHIYKEEYPDLTGKLSIALDIDWSEPATNSSGDIEAAERRNLFEFGLYGHPIFLGNWPQVVIDRVGNRSHNEHRNKSRLPELTQQEIDDIKGTTDFMAINTYTTHLVSDVEESEYGEPGYLKDMKAKAFFDPSWTIAPNGNAVVPGGVRTALNWLKTIYNNPDIFITESGVSDQGSTDFNRINFYISYLSAILEAMYEDNVKVFGYIARSLMDCFEWTEGYSQQYGFHITDVNRTDVVFKQSAYFYSKLVTTLRIPPAEDYTTPAPVTPTTDPGGAATVMTLYPSLILLAAYLSFLVS